MTEAIIEQFKTCAKCRETKSVKCFYPRSNVGGFTDNCRRCRKPMSNAQEVVGTLKRCSRCKELKPFPDFSQQQGTSTGRAAHCKPCARKSWRQRHPPNPSKLVVALPGEEWRPVVGFEGELSVSNLGRVRRDRAMKRTFANRLLKPTLTNAGTGYYTVGIRRRNTLVHRLVAEAFLEPDKRHLQVNHKNGIGTDNRAENLEFITHAENMAHAAGVLKRCGARKLDDVKVKALRKKFATGRYTRTALANEYGVAITTISKAIDRVWWKHVE